MSKKVKILIVIGGFFAILTLSILVLIIKTADISKEEIGQSPFKVEASFSSEENKEYLEIIRIANEIKGFKEFIEKYDLNLKEPEPSILLLQEFFQRNDSVVDKINLELINKCKFPKPVVDDKGLESLSHLLKIMQFRITLYILKNDFEKSKKGLVLANQIGSELTNKSTGVLNGMIILAFKVSELKNIKLFLSQNFFSIGQKLDIVNIKLDLIPSQFLQTVFHFEEEFFYLSLQETNNSNSNKKYLFKDMKYYPVFNSFSIQPNKSIKIFREAVIEINQKFEEGSNNSYVKLRKKENIKRNFSEVWEGNMGGKIIVDMSIPVFYLVSCKILSYNSLCNQILLAQKILEYNLTKGSFPTNLEELNLEKQTYTDILTGEPFLYSEQNGILQSIGRNNENCNIEMTTKKLSPEEINEYLVESESTDDFVLYLK